MNNPVNIAVVGLGQVGIYLLNELNNKKKDIEIKTGRKINLVAISARSINKKRRFKINKKIFFKNPLEIFKVFGGNDVSMGFLKQNFPQKRRKNFFLLNLSYFILQK